MTQRFYCETCGVYVDGTSYSDGKGGLLHLDDCGPVVLRARYVCQCCRLDIVESDVRPDGHGGLAHTSGQVGVRTCHGFTGASCGPVKRMIE